MENPMRPKLTGLFAVALSALMPPGPAYAQEEPTFIMFGAPMAGPRGFVQMCREGGVLCGRSNGGDPCAVETAARDSAPLSTARPSPEVCGTRPESYPAALAIDKADGVGADGRDHKLVAEVNRFVNSRVKQRTDKQIYGVNEVWTRSGTGKNAQGDCEDIAIEKRLVLIERGFPPDRLFFAVVYLPSIGLHTILVARLHDGDYLLDNRSPYVEPWSKVRYIWLSIQNPADATLWHVPGRKVMVQAGHRRNSA